jgi:biotin carboxyl carrier protein
MTYDVEIDDVRRSISVRAAQEGGWWVRLDDGDEQHITGGPTGVSEWLLTMGSKRHRVGVAVDGSKAWMQIDGHGLHGSIRDPRASAELLGSGDGLGTLSTPMPGVVSRILVAQGDEVAEGQVLLVVEAMKMENEHKSPFAGVVTEVNVSAGQAVEADAPLLTVEAG